MKKLISVILLVCVLISSLSSLVFAEDLNLIKEIVINQGLGYSISRDSGQLLPLENFVANKNTAIFVILNKKVTVDSEGSSQLIKISKDGKEITSLKPVLEIGDVDLLKFIPKKISDVSDWESGTYEIDAEINGEKLSKTITLKQRKVLNILAVPVKANYGGEVKSVSGEWKQANSFIEKVYPVKNGGINWELANELDASDNSFDLRTNDGQYNLWKSLSDLQITNPDGTKKYELIVGFVKDRQGAESTLQGFTFGKPANIVTESDQDMLATVAHEVAHCYEVGDEYSGGAFNFAINMPPEGMKGTDWNQREKEITADNKYFKGESDSYGDGSIVDKEQIPYDFDSGNIDKKVSFMGSGGKQENYWITGEIWNQLYKSFDVSATSTKPTNTVAPSTETVTEKTSDESKLENGIEISGYIHDDGNASVDPWFVNQYENDSFELSDKGEYCVCALDESKNVLTTHKFDVSFYSNDVNMGKLDKAPFDFIIKYPDNTKFFEIKKGDKVLKTVNLSKNTPKLSFDSIKEGTKMSGKKTVTWSASDEDNDKLFYEVWYSPDGNDWEVLDSLISNSSIDINFDELSGGKNARLYVYVTDGVNTSEIESPIFEVEDKNPEISLTNEKTTFSSNDEIILDANVIDLEDNNVEDSSIKWLNDKNEVIGEGFELYIAPRALEAGDHSFNIEAQDKSGNKVVKTVTIKVKDEITVTFDGNLIDFDVKPIIIEGRTMVPVRKVLEAMGAEVSWNAETQEITILKGSDKYIMKIGSYDTYFNNEKSTIDVTPQIIEGRTLLPIRFVVEKFGKKVDWNSNTQTVVIK